MEEISTSLKALRIRIGGIVQGVGFRPFIYRLARGFNIKGWVINRNDGVIIHAEGNVFEIDRFFGLVQEQAPAAASISCVEGKAVTPDNYERFTIKESQIFPGSITGISPDIAVCADCLEDMKTQPHRIAYPLINCTNCGPRFSIIWGLPYDRVHTSMNNFAMCAVCKQEYIDPDNRRFHAQPLACNDCGPVYSMETEGIFPGRAGSEEVKPDQVNSYEHIFDESGFDLEKLCRVMEDGGVAAIKGTGGYNLVCDAMNRGAVERIRNIKGRERKPFAVMFRDAEKVREYCKADEKEVELLQSWRRPVVLLRKNRNDRSDKVPGVVKDITNSDTGSGISKVKSGRIISGDNRKILSSAELVTESSAELVTESSAELVTESSAESVSESSAESVTESGAESAADGTILSEVCGGLNTIGAILPYMPFHYLLFDKLKLEALVFTSANISGDPIVFDDEEVRALFGKKIDALVDYNRKIINPVDDSVCLIAGGNIQILRRARGYVPEMIEIPFNTEGIFAAGSDLKNTFAIGKGNQGIMSQHIGDLENYETFCRYRNSIDRFSSVFSFTPGLVACDLHPGFHSARFAAGMAQEAGSKLIKVQHHHAHIASCMAEHSVDGPVIGVCFDGTGFGDDRNIWGSEFMISDYSGYERHSHFSYIPLPGGDAAIREPWRIALSYLKATGYRDAEKWIGSILSDIPVQRIDAVERMIAGGINSPLSCGAGRLFDAVAALTGVCIESGYDGEAPMLLESICCPDIFDSYEFSADTLVVIDQVMADINMRTAPEIIASRFHNGMAKAVYDNVILMHSVTGIDKVVLSGGVFQNSYLLNRVMHLLGQERLKVFTNKMVPGNDGGLALGQLAIAAQKTGRSCA